MLARVWGSRGSLATSGADMARYGGNTSCIELVAEDSPSIILDAGTGIRVLGDRLHRERATEIHVLLSHLHLDHLQGLAFFRPLYDEDVELHLWGPPSPIHGLRERVGAYMSEPLFPVNISEVPCRAVFHDAPEDGIRIGAVDVWAAPVAHVGPTTGYRLEHAGASLAYIPDHEPALGGSLRGVDASWVSGYGLARDADVLFHDSQYFEHEYPHHVGWGHSSVAHTVEFARIARARQLVLFHHDPGHGDDDLDRKLVRAAELWKATGGGTPPVIARDGMETLVGSGLPAAPPAPAMRA